MKVKYKSNISRSGDIMGGNPNFESCDMQRTGERDTLSEFAQNGAEAPSPSEGVVLPNEGIKCRERAERANLRGRTVQIQKMCGSA